MKLSDIKALKNMPVHPDVQRAVAKQRAKMQLDAQRQWREFRLLEAERSYYLEQLMKRASLPRIPEHIWREVTEAAGGAAITSAAAINALEGHVEAAAFDGDEEIRIPIDVADLLIRILRKQGGKGGRPRNRKGMLEWQLETIEKARAIKIELMSSGLLAKNAEQDAAARAAQDTPWKPKTILNLMKRRGGYNR